MGDRGDVRVSDGEREAAVQRLRRAMDEGRLDLFEYDTRLGLAYGAVTYRDLEVLFTDLPGSSERSGSRAAVRRPRAPEKAPVQAGPTSFDPIRGRFERARDWFLADPAGALKVLWMTWWTLLLVNLTVWFLLSVNDIEGTKRFWPMWFAVPGVVLLGLTVWTVADRRRRR